MVMKSRGPGPPASFGGWRVLILALLISLFGRASAEGNKIYDMQTLCEDRFRQALYRKIEGAYLKSQNERNLDCIVTFQTHSILQRFMLRFDLLQLDCNDHLFIYDGAHAVDSYKEPATVEEVSSKQLKLTRQAKGWLRIPVEERTEEEKEMLSKIMGQLQCFDRYPEKVRESLTASAMFNYFPPGRVLVAEGHPSIAMYFILTGSANISKLTFDPGVKKFKSVDVSVINAGYAFGEINILHNEPWPTTVTTATHIEILTVLKENFQMILEEFLGEQNREITKCLNQFTYFKNWNQRTIVECCILARVVQYTIDRLIIGENCGDFDNSYFIVSGCCRVVYHLQFELIPRKHFTEQKIINPDIVTEDESFPTSYTVKGIERPRRRQIAEPFITGLIVDKLLTQIINELPLAESRQKEPDPGKNLVEKSVESHFFQIAELMPGACFGIGESLDKKFILSSTENVVLLCIPKFFLKMHNLGNIWGRVRELYNHTYPNPQTISSHFLIDRKWNSSRAKYLNSLIKAERPFTGLTCAEAPYHTRLTTDFENPVFRRVNKIVREMNESRKRSPSSA